MMEKRKNEKDERKLVPLRVNENTVIYVTPDKCNEEYAKDYIRRVGLCCKRG